MIKINELPEKHEEPRLVEFQVTEKHEEPRLVEFQVTEKHEEPRLVEFQVTDEKHEPINLLVEENENGVQTLKRKSELPDVVTNPKTGRYLITPAIWNGDEKQALYQVNDLMHLMDAMKKVFTFESVVYRPKVVNVEAKGDGTFTIGIGDTLYRIDDDGFISEVETSESGQGLVEYALILVMVAIVVIVILVILGPAISNVYSNIVANL